MKKTLMALGAAAALTVSAVAIPAPAHAQRGVAAGVAAGLIGGAIVGGAIASQNGYYYGPGYYAPGYMAARPMWSIPATANPASGSGSGSGTVMAGGSATSGFATNEPFIFIKSRPTSRNSARFSGMHVISGLKKPFFSATLRNVYFRLTHVRFFSETAVRNSV